MTKIPDRIGPLARKADVAVGTLRGYARAGLLECARDANGNWLFPPGQEQRVREIYAERMARRGRRLGA